MLWLLVLKDDDKFICLDKIHNVTDEQTDS